jgi:hypothetical protein
MVGVGIEQEPHGRVSENRNRKSRNRTAKTEPDWSNSIKSKTTLSILFATYAVDREADSPSGKLSNVCSLKICKKFENQTFCYSGIESVGPMLLNLPDRTVSFFIFCTMERQLFSTSLVKQII